jgi:hypothetical protein
MPQGISRKAWKITETEQALLDVDETEYISVTRYIG